MWLRTWLEGTSTKRVLYLLTNFLPAMPVRLEMTSAQLPGSPHTGAPSRITLCRLKKRKLRLRATRNSTELQRHARGGRGKLGKLGGCAAWLRSVATSYETGFK